MPDFLNSDSQCILAKIVNIAATVDSVAGTQVVQILSALTTPTTEMHTVELPSDRPAVTTTENLYPTENQKTILP